jgi:hypothetical protein
MTPVAIVFLVLALVVVWGGLAASIMFLRRRPELTEYPPGGTDDARGEGAPIVHDT